jgi:hypothetical protein
MTVKHSVWLKYPPTGLQEEPEVDEKAQKTKRIPHMMVELGLVGVNQRRNGPPRDVRRRRRKRLRLVLGLEAPRSRLSAVAATSKSKGHQEAVRRVLQAGRYKDPHTAWPNAKTWYRVPGGKDGLLEPWF